MWMKRGFFSRAWEVGIPFLRLSFTCVQIENIQAFKKCRLTKYTSINGNFYEELQIRIVFLNFGYCLVSFVSNKLFRE